MQVIDIMKGAVLTIHHILFVVHVTKPSLKAYNIIFLAKCLGKKDILRHIFSFVALSETLLLQDKDLL